MIGLSIAAGCFAFPVLVYAVLLLLCWSLKKHNANGADTEKWFNYCFNFLSSVWGRGIVFISVLFIVAIGLTAAFMALFQHVSHTPKDHSDDNPADTKQLYTAKMCTDEAVKKGAPKSPELTRTCALLESKKFHTDDKDTSKFKEAAAEAYRTAYINEGLKSDEQKTFLRGPSGGLLTRGEAMQLSPKGFACLYRAQMFEEKDNDSCDPAFAGGSKNVQG